MDWKTLLAYLTGMVDQERWLRNEYLVMENRILRNARLDKLLQRAITAVGAEEKILLPAAQRWRGDGPAAHCGQTAARSRGPRVPLSPFA